MLWVQGRWRRKAKDTYTDLKRRKYHDAHLSMSKEDLLAWAQGERKEGKDEPTVGPDELNRRALLLNQCLKHGAELTALLRKADVEMDGLASLRDFYAAIRLLRIDRDVVAFSARYSDIERRASAEQYTGTRHLSHPTVASLFSVFSTGDVEDATVSEDSTAKHRFLRYAEWDAHLRRYGAERRRRASLVAGRSIQRIAEAALHRALHRLQARSFAAWVDQNQRCRRRNNQMRRMAARFRTPKLAEALSFWREDFEETRDERRREEAAERLAALERAEAAARARIHVLPETLLSAPLSVQSALKRERKRLIAEWDA